MRRISSDDGIDLLFRAARSHSRWQDREISDVLLQAVYDLAKFAPTSANFSPMRVIFIRSPEAKARLRPALGLDCGPLSGFDNELVDREFFPEGRIKSNFLCNLAYGDASKLRPRAPRLDFEEACQLL